MSHVANKSKNEILEDMYGTSHPGSIVHEQQKAAISVRCTEEIEQALNTLTQQLMVNNESSQKVSSRILWLNIVLAIAAVVGATATAVTAFK